MAGIRWSARASAVQSERQIPRHRRAGRDQENRAALLSAGVPPWVHDLDADRDGAARGQPDSADPPIEKHRQTLKTIVQNLWNGEIALVEQPAPALAAGH